nr:immunoglobulin light chain junction region [Macaca mulatta]
DYYCSLYIRSGISVF